MTGNMLHILFTDIAGVHRQVSIAVDGVPETLEGIRAGIDGSSIPGYGRIERSDLFVEPASSTIVDLSSFNGGYMTTGRIVTHTGEPHPWDPRSIAGKTVEKAWENGYVFRAGCELEFYITGKVGFYLGRRRQGLLVSTSKGGVAGQVVKSHYVSEIPLEVEEALSDVIRVLGNNGISVSKIHRENGFLNQYELSLSHRDPLGLGDSILLSVASVKRVLNTHGFNGVFMPKPFADDYGSGLHIHVSMWIGDRNIFFDGGELTDAGRYFIGGILDHARSLTAFTNPSVNSFRRLIEGFEAPVYISWGIGNRSTMVRVPLNGGRIEVRTPDASMNPYLGISAILLAGLDGLRKKTDPGSPVDYNMYDKPSTSSRLPRSLEEAVESLLSDHEYLKPLFPRDMLEYYAELKLREARRNRSIPSVADYVDLEHLV